MKIFSIRKAVSIVFTAGMLTILAAGLTACSDGGHTADQSENADSEFVFTYARPASVTSLDLHTEITSNNAFAIDKIFEPLVMFDENGDIYDYLAESHEISEDGLDYTFVLKDGIRFSNGNAVTAEDAVFSLNRHLEIGGALPIEAEIETIEAVNDKTVHIRLKNAFTPFLSELANFSNGIMPADLDGMTEEEFFKAPVGTGPFKVEEWDPAGELVFSKNGYYWQEGEPVIDKLIYKVVDDDNQAVNQLKTGEVDAVEGLSYTAAAELEAGGETSVIKQNGWTVEEIFFNTLDEHFADAHVRRALAMAIDREALTVSQTHGYAVTANTVLPAAIRYNTSESVSALPYNVDNARAELAKSAYPDGFDTTLSIASGNNTTLQEAQIIQAAGKEIGINIEIKQQELAAFREDFKSLNYSMMINSATADYPDANAIFAFQVDPEGFSKCYWTSYYNENAVKLLHDGQVTADGEERADIYAGLQQVLADDVPYIPLYYPEVLIGVRNDIEGLKALPNGTVVFNNAVRN